MGGRGDERTRGFLAEDVFDSVGGGDEVGWVAVMREKMHQF